MQNRLKLRGQLLPPVSVLALAPGLVPSLVSHGHHHSQAWDVEGSLLLFVS